MGVQQGKDEVRTMDKYVTCMLATILIIISIIIVNMHLLSDHIEIFHLVTLIPPRDEAIKLIQVDPSYC